MSENHDDNKAGQTTVNVAQFSTMGNLFIKEDAKGLDNQRVTPFTNENGCERLCSPSSILKPDQDYNFKFFEKVTNQVSLETDVEETPVLDSEKVILNAFLNEVRNAKPIPLKNWSALQHYIYFIYRHVISSKPCNSNEVFPNVITRKIRELVESLLQEDVTQLCIRLVTLVREYAIITRGHFSSLQHPKVTGYLVSLMSYYSAFCSAASKLAPLLPEFDFIIMERFNVNWLCLNKSIFYHYVYMSPSVQDKIPAFTKLKEENKPQNKNLLESYACFSVDMALLASRWATLRARISTLSQKRALSNPGKHLMNDWKMFEEHKKILNTNYWMIRNTQAMQIQDMVELDSNILSLVGDTDHISDFLIDPHGSCMCEDCLAAEFKSNSTHISMSPSFQTQSSHVCRIITCYICQEPIALDALASHIVTKHHDSPSQKPTRVYLTPHQKRLFCPKRSKIGDTSKSKEIFPFEGLFEKNSDFKESILKIVNGCSSKTNLTDSVGKSEDIRKFKPELKEPVFQSIRKVSLESREHSGETEELKHKPAGSSRANNETFSVNKSTSPIFQASLESTFKTTKEPIFKIASEAPIMPNGSEIMFTGASKTNDEISCKAAISEYLKMRSDSGETRINKNHKTAGDSTNQKTSEVFKKGVELFVNKDIPKSVVDKTFNDVEKSVGIGLAAVSARIKSENAAFRKPQQKPVNTADPKVMELLKSSANSQQKATTTPNLTQKSNDNPCLGHACGHKCKQEGEKPTDTRKHSCQDTCEHYKESRKCDCAYCEVFGSSLPPHTHKTSETRDRLRTRLNQRKEKVSDSLNKGNPKVLATNSKIVARTAGNSISSKPEVKVSEIVNKVRPIVKESDSRVPPRVPEVFHPMPPPVNVKPAAVVSELKRSSSSTTADVQKIPVNRVQSVNSLAEKNQTGTDPSRPLSSLSSSSLNSVNADSRDINELLNYIEGNKTIDKAALAQKKAAKKERQRLKKVEERERIETEKRLKEEAILREEKRKEEERLKNEALARQLAEKQKKNKKAQDDRSSKQDKKNTKKKGKGNNEANNKEIEKNNSNLIEETIPAMVTIKRVVEGDNSPATVTITLKGSTPESDQLLFTLVNGHSKTEQVATATINSNNKGGKNKNDSKATSQQNCNNKNGSVNNSDNFSNSKKKKKKKEQVDQVTTKEVQVTIAVNKNNLSQKESTKKKNVKIEEPKANENRKVRNINKETEQISKNGSSIRGEEISLPMLRLPPGITITKIEGPPANKKASHNTASISSNSNVPVSKSGVIVVDTEKLIQQSITASNNKKSKKKNKKKAKAETEEREHSAGMNGSSMVTLKNPIFHTLQTNINNKPSKAQPDSATLFSNNQQASIFKNENGMVTIRSPRLQNPFENGSPISNFLSDLKPMFAPEVKTPYSPARPTTFSETSKNSSFNAQEILSGLPGIEITKVDKSAPKVTENKKASQAAEVSIIPTSNGGDKFNFDKEDWTFESVFTPRDEGEDMDADERELEAFKRFCQQSVPPERKEKVAHLNVKDIVLKKKVDVSYT